MTDEVFERLLDQAVAQLTTEAQQPHVFDTAKKFENRVRDVLNSLGRLHKLDIDNHPHPYAFPDITLGEFGVEVKFTSNNTWRSVANSIFETFRNPVISQVYIIFGKMGGEPAVKWGRYRDIVIHVRTSHVPRFEVEIPTSPSAPQVSLFEKMGISYEDFCVLPIEQKMHYVRQYARGRLKEGERLWWLEEKPEQEHSLPIQVTMYMDLPQAKKRTLRAEAALLCPQIVKSSRAKKKYDDAALYILTYHGVLCSQARDLFSAGSVAHRAVTRGGNYIQLALADIEGEMRDAAMRMDDALFVEYWGESVPPEERIQKWLIRADELASDWRPSDVLFRNDPT